VILEIENLSAHYGRARALHNVSLSLEEGAIHGIIGSNGAGKSTLFDSLMGMVDVSGVVRFDGNSIVGLDTPQVIKAGIGYAPERAHLFPFMSVEENLLVGAYTAKNQIEENLAIVHDLFPVLKERRKQETHTQSGGERQMVSLGRALMGSPRLLLVDEPTIGLAPRVCSEIAAALTRLNREFGMTILMAEQNVNFTLSMANQLDVLETGEIKMSGPTAELINDASLRDAYFGG